MECCARALGGQRPPRVPQGCPPCPGTGTGLLSQDVTTEHRAREALQHHLSHRIVLIRCLSSPLMVINVCKRHNEHLSLCSDAPWMHLPCFSPSLAGILGCA